MNNRSLIRLIAFFFFLIFAIINALFWIAHQHFIKEQESDRMQRFALAERLIHHPLGKFDPELKQLMVEISPLSPDFLRTNGKDLSVFPFGKIIEYQKRIYFIKTPPPKFFPGGRPPFFDNFPPPMGARFPPPKHFNTVLEDTKVPSSLPFWVVILAIDLLLLLFFSYILQKLLPLHRLKNAIIHFKEGDTRLNVLINGEDEVSQITQEFNLVLEKIASMKEARSLFLRNILHELKTPIMKGSLTADCIGESTEKERLKRIFDRMDYLLGEFSRMERFNSGEWHLNLQEYRFVDLLDHTCDILLCEKKNITIKGEESALIIHVDFELFAIAMKNILDNALKYSNSKPILTILSHAIEICSVGDPLSEENQNFLKPFNRTYESTMTGLGLGLYITHSILQKHGFTFEYRYNLGVNCFRIVLH